MDAQISSSSQNSPAPTPPTNPDSHKQQPSLSTQGSPNQPPSAPQNLKLPPWTNSIYSNISYSPSSTLILIGGRGAGKSTLAVLAAIALRRRYVDVAATIASTLQTSAEEYILQHGVEKYRDLEYELLSTAIKKYPTDCVIACSSECIEGKSSQLLLECLPKFPIIHVTRSISEVKEHLLGNKDAHIILHKTIKNLPLYRQYSNFEYTNLGTLFLDTIKPSTDFSLESSNSYSFANFNSSSSSPSSKPPKFFTPKERISLGLRRLEQNFLYFLKYIYGEKSILRQSISKPSQSLVQSSARPEPYQQEALRRPWKPVEEKSSPFSQTLFLPFYDIISSGIDFDRHAVGVDAVTIRIDLLASYALRMEFDPFFYISSQLIFVKNNTTLPIVYDFDSSFFTSFRRLNNNTNSMTTENDAIAFYIEMLIFGLRLNVEYLVVYPAFIPENIFKQIINRKHFTKIISAHTVDTWDLAQFLQIKKEAYEKSCDIVQITNHAYSLQQNIDLMKIGTRTCTMMKHKDKNSDKHIHKKVKLSEESNNETEEPNLEEDLEESQIPIIAYNTGSLGRMSKSLNRLLTPVEHEAFLDNPRSFYYKSNTIKSEFAASASNARIRPNQDDDPWLVGLKGRTLETLFTLKDRNNCIYSSGLQPKLHFYHFGNNVEKRLSHVVHQAAFDAIHLPHRYSKKWSSQIREIQPYFEQPEFGGAALSQPFKVESLQLCDTLSSHARFIGAINTITTTRLPGTLATASIHGDNVDWVAIHTCLSKYLRPQNIITPESRVLILGAGGFGHAAVYALARLGVRKFYIYNRTRENAELLVSHFQTLFSRNNIFPVDKISTNEGPRGDFATRNEEISTFLHNKRPRRLLLKSILNDEEESNSSCQDDATKKEDASKSSQNPESSTANKASPTLDNNNENQQSEESTTASHSTTNAIKPSSTSTKGKSAGAPPVPFKHPFQKIYAESPEKFWAEIIENSKGKRNYGSLTFQNDSTDANKFSFTILDDVSDTPWPDPTHGPRLILQMSSNSDITLHPSFYESPSNPISVNGQGLSRNGVSRSSRARICLDSNYIPSQVTPFIRQALSYRQQDQNVEVIGGAGLMIEQAFDHFEMLTEKRAPKAVMVETLKKALNELDNARSLDINNNLSAFPNLESGKPRSKPANNINIDDSSSDYTDNEENLVSKLPQKPSNIKNNSLSDILINNDQEQSNVATTSNDRPTQASIASPSSSISFTSYSSASASEIEED